MLNMYCMDTYFWCVVVELLILLPRSINTNQSKVEVVASVSLYDPWFWNICAGMEISL